MVRNTELKETSAATKLIAETVASMINKAGWSQARTGRIIDKSQSYASLRIKGLASWTTDDLDNLAKALDYIESRNSIHVRNCWIVIGVAVGVCFLAMIITLASSPM